MCWTTVAFQLERCRRRQSPRSQSNYRVCCHPTVRGPAGRSPIRFKSATFHRRSPPAANPILPPPPPILSSLDNGPEIGNLHLRFGVSAVLGFRIWRWRASSCHAQHVGRVSVVRRFGHSKSGPRCRRLIPNSSATHRLCGVQRVGCRNGDDAGLTGKRRRVAVLDQLRSDYENLYRKGTGRPGAGPYSRHRPPMPSVIKHPSSSPSRPLPRRFRLSCPAEHLAARDAVHGRNDRAANAHWDLGDSNRPVCSVGSPWFRRSTRNCR